LICEEVQDEIINWIATKAVISLVFIKCVY
jgi:hypothetical protein